MGIRNSYSVPGDYKRAFRHLQRVNNDTALGIASKPSTHRSGFRGGMSQISMVDSLFSRVVKANVLPSVEILASAMFFRTMPAILPPVLESRNVISGLLSSLPGAFIPRYLVHD